MDPDKKPTWKHPYSLYIILTVVIFGVMLVAGFLAIQGGCIASR